MTAIVSLLMLTLSAGGAEEGRFAHAVEVFACNFDASWDKDFTGWPEGWTRKRGPGYPFYLKMRIAQDAPPPGGRSLEILLDGGAAAALSPPRPIDPAFDYVAEAWVKTSDLEHDRVFLTLTVTDEHGQAVDRFESERIGRAKEWRKLRIAPVRIGDAKARRVVIGLHVEPAQLQDLSGNVCFGGVWLGRIPQTRLTTSDRHNFFTDAQKVELRLHVSGEFNEPPTLAIRLEDALGHCIDEIEETPKMKQNGGASVGAMRWSPRVGRTGFYRALATVRQGDSVCDRREVTLAVVEPAPPVAGSEFGLSVPDGELPLGYDDLARLAGHAGIGWLKAPLWLDPADEGSAQAMIAFCQAVRDQGIEPVGLLSRPPQALLDKLVATRMTAADLFTRDPETWYPQLQPTLVRLAAQVGFWQLGNDDDCSLVDYPRLDETMARIKKAFDRIGQDTRLGMSWLPDNPPEPLLENPPWRFLSFATRAEDDAKKIARIACRAPGAQVRRWLMIEPAARGAMPTAGRAAELVQRMAAAKIAGADAIFCTNPFDPATGLMRPDGTPGELFLPWRIAAQCLGGAEYLGSAVLPHGSDNHVFLRDKDAVMLIWNCKLTTEPLTLGPDARRIDLWGRGERPAVVGERQAVAVETTPCFIVGISKPLARWMLSLDLARHEASTSFGTLQENAIRVKNPFPEKISGRIALGMPAGWDAAPSVFDFEVSPNAQYVMPFSLVLPYNAQTGPQRVRLDCSLRGEENHALTVYREVSVGCPDLAVRVVTEVNRKGELEVVQRLSNRGENGNFRCELFIPGRLRKALIVNNLGNNEDKQIYRIADGAEFVGKVLWLHIEEIGGSRVLNHRFIVEE